MWVKLVEIVETRVKEKGRQPRPQLARAVNALYGAMTNCHIAFRRCENEQTETNFSSFVFAIDALISTLQNLNPQIEIFDPELADRLEHYALGDSRIAAMARPRELVKSQLKLLRELVRTESDALHLPLEEFGSFSEALETLGRFIKQTFTMEEIFEPQVL